MKIDDKSPLKKHKVFIGYDSRQTLAYDVSAFSFKNTASEPEKLQVIPVQLEDERIQKILSTRPLEKRVDGYWDPISQAPQSTEFTISRFCIPKLTKGWALFVDSDVVSICDVAEIFERRNSNYAVMVVKHNYEPKDRDKGGDLQQFRYPKKNWSSVILWNCDHPAHQNLTDAMLNNLPGRELHGFCWLKDEEIGELPEHCNWLVDENGYEASPKQLLRASLLHYTLGGPWMENWEPKASDVIWNDIRQKMVESQYGKRIANISSMNKTGQAREKKEGIGFFKKLKRYFNRLKNA